MLSLATIYKLKAPKNKPKTKYKHLVILNNFIHYHIKNSNNQASKIYIFIYATKSK